MTYDHNAYERENARKYCIAFYSNTVPDALAEYAEKLGITKTAAVRKLVEDGLRREGLLPEKQEEK